VSTIDVRVVQAIAHKEELIAARAASIRRGAQIDVEESLRGVERRSWWYLHRFAFIDLD
jgi:hypothetical protein